MTVFFFFFFFKQKTAYEILTCDWSSDVCSSNLLILQFRGAVFLILSIFGILFFDHDDYDAEKGEGFHPEGQHNGIIRHTFYHFLSWSGLSDHKVR